MCGIHLGGCGMPITGKCEVDHIVPLGLAELIASNAREFDGLWNYQPMHERCNRNKADTMNGRSLEDLEIAVTVGANTPDDCLDSNANATTFKYSRRSLRVHAGTSRYRRTQTVSRSRQGLR